jgi:hypothetical protein
MDESPPSVVAKRVHGYSCQDLQIRYSGCSILGKTVLVTGIDVSVYTRGLQQNCAIGILEDAMPHERTNSRGSDRSVEFGWEIAA